MGWWKTRWRMGYRFKKLTQRAYKEAGVKQPIGIVNVPLWPKSFMDNFKDISFEKTYDFNFIGCINIQLRKTNKGPLLFEINPRISSTVVFRDKMGFTDLKWWIMDLLELQIPKYTKPRTGLKFYRGIKEYIY